MVVKILIVLVAVIVILLIVALFSKKEYKVEREITVNKPKQEVFNYVKYVKNQDYYNKWVMLDPTMKKDFRGTDGTVGFVYAWDSNNKQAGKGEQEIKKITEGEEFNIEVRFKKPFENTADTFMRTESVAGNKTRVTWGMKGRNPYPMNLMNLFMDNLLGKDIVTSLTNLKTVLEKS
jgi:Polyketide cyclase / dehydrase and lipid transport